MSIIIICKIQDGDYEGKLLTITKRKSGKKKCIVRSREEFWLPTFDEPFTGCTPASANAEVSYPEWFRIGVAQERIWLAFFAHRKNSIVPSADFVKRIKE